MTEPEGDKPDEKTIGGRLTKARLLTAVHVGYTVSRAKMGELVGKEVGRKLDEKQWRRYESGESEPPLDVIAAAARVSELPPEYIAFNKKPSVMIDEDSLIDIPDDAVERAERQAEATRSARAAKKGGKQRPA